MFSARRILAVGLCMFLCCTAREVYAQRYKLDLRIDIPLIGLGAAVTFAGLLKRSELPACAHYDSAASATVAPLALTAIDTRFEGIVAEVIVLAEAILLTQLITQLTAGAVLSLCTGVATVLSGAHFWTDIMAGAVAGSAIGALVPLMHVRFD
jgi:membrane-associated phospholipid phosphatase